VRWPGLLPMEPAKHSPLVKKPDGSLKIAIGPTRWSPASPEANWLPLAPREAFSLTFHTYVPKEGPQKCEWSPAAVTKAI
jgi:hypothetical protein